MLFILWIIPCTFLYTARATSGLLMKWYQMGSVQQDSGINLFLIAKLNSKEITHYLLTFFFSSSFFGSDRECISKRLSVKYLTSDAVIDYIQQHQLYIHQNNEDPSSSWVSKTRLLAARNLFGSRLYECFFLPSNTQFFFKYNYLFILITCFCIIFFLFSAF